MSVGSSTGVLNPPEQMVMDFTSNSPFKIICSHSKPVNSLLKKYGPSSKCWILAGRPKRAWMGSFLDRCPSTSCVDYDKRFQMSPGKTLVCLIHHNHHLTHLTKVASKMWKGCLRPFLNQPTWIWLNKGYYFAYRCTMTRLIDIFYSWLIPGGIDRFCFKSLQADRTSHWSERKDSFLPPLHNSHFSEELILYKLVPSIYWDIFQNVHKTFVALLLKCVFVHEPYGIYTYIALVVKKFLYLRKARVSFTSHCPPCYMHTPSCHIPKNLPFQGRSTISVNMMYHEIHHDGPYISLDSWIPIIHTSKGSFFIICFIYPSMDMIHFLL